MKKYSYISYDIFLKFFKYKHFFKNDNFKIWSRSSTILPIMINSIIYVYNGKKFIPLYILDTMIGHKIGEFIFTRFFKAHTNKNLKKKQALQKKANNVKKTKIKN